MPKISKQQNNTKQQNNKINLKPLLDKVSKVLEEGLQELLNEFMNDYDLYKETHDAVINLPIVKRITKTLTANKVVKALQNKIFDLQNEVDNLQNEKQLQQTGEEHISLKIIENEICEEEKKELPKIYEIIIKFRNKD